MDKETLSNYGWIVICVIVLAVIIALAGPFGNFVADAVKSTTQGLFDTNQSALNAANVSGLTIKNQKFETATMGNDSQGDISQTPVIPQDPVVIAGAMFDYYWVYDESTGEYRETYEETFVTWEELKNQANGTKHEYQAHKVGDTTIGDEAFVACNPLISITFPDNITDIGVSAFASCYFIKTIDLGKCINLTTINDYTFETCFNITSITLPKGLTSIGKYAFNRCSALESITFKGSTAQWNNINFGEKWNFGIPATEVICSDGTVSLS